MRKRKPILATVLVIILYILLKEYVAQTPTLKDDPLPDVIYKLLATNQDQ